MTKTETALELIRDRVPRLRELSFGCKIMVNGRTGILIRYLKEKKAPYFYEFRMDNDEYGVFSGGVKKLSDIKIIGHEVQLNDLLFAIKQTEYTCHFSSNGHLHVVHPSKQERFLTLDYDLTKSVEENLNKNPELCEFLIQLLTPTN